MKIIICRCWPPSGPSAGENQVFDDSYVVVGLLVDLRRQKNIFLFFKIAPERDLRCGNDKFCQMNPKSAFKIQKGTLCVDLLPKHSKNINLVPRLYIKISSNSKLLTNFFWGFFCGYHLPKEERLNT